MHRRGTKACACHLDFNTTIFHMPFDSNKITIIYEF